MPAHRHVRASVRCEAREIHVHSEAEELLDFLGRHPPDLAPPCLLRVCHRHLPKNEGRDPIVAAATLPIPLWYLTMADGRRMTLSTSRGRQKCRIPPRS